MTDNNVHDYTACLLVSPKYLDENIKIKSDDSYVINHIKKIVDNVRKVVDQMESHGSTELDDLYIRLPFDSRNPIILGSIFTNKILMQYYFGYYHYIDFDKKISPLNVSRKNNYMELYYCYFLPIQLLDYILNFDSVLDVIYYKVSNDGHIHVFTIFPDHEKQLYIEYIGSDILIFDKLKKNCHSKLNDVQTVEEFMEIAGHIFRSTAKSARN